MAAICNRQTDREKNRQTDCNSLLVLQTSQVLLVHCYLLTDLLSLWPHDYSRVTWSQPATPLVIRGMTTTITTTIRYVEHNTTHISHEYANEIWLFSGTKIALSNTYRNKQTVVTKGNMTSSTKPEVHNVLHCRHSRTKLRPQAEYRANFMTFRLSRTWLLRYASRQTDRQTGWVQYCAALHWDSK